VKLNARPEIYVQFQTALAPPPTFRKFRSTATVHPELSKAFDA